MSTSKRLKISVDIQGHSPAENDKNSDNRGAGDIGHNVAKPAPNYGRSAATGKVQLP